MEGPTALARELGMSDYGAPRKIRDWVDDKFSPNYEATMLMLERAGLLDLEAARRRRALTDPSPLSPRQEYLIKAAAEGCPPDALAVIFNVSEDEANAELQTARDELESWQETRRKEETEPAEQPAAPEEASPAQGRLADDPRYEQYKETLRRAVLEWAGESDPENPDLQPTDILALLLDASVKMEKRLDDLEQGKHPPEPEAE